jgi:lysozyme
MSKSLYARIAVGALSLSAIGFAGIALNEGYSTSAIKPVPGDPWTVGLGSTKRDDGTPVQAGDKITPPQAIRRAVKHVAGDEKVLRACFGENAELHQHEWDAYVDLAYNVGAPAVCRSSIVRKVQSGNYEAACKTILDFKRVQGRDCSLAQNKGFCGGVWTRRQEYTHLCLTGERP